MLLSLFIYLFGKTGCHFSLFFLTLLCLPLTLVLADFLFILFYLLILLTQPRSMQDPSSRPGIERTLEAGILFFFFPFIFIGWRLITLHYCSGFCHTLTWVSHGFTCVPHPDPSSRLPPHPIPLGLPSAPALSTCLMHPTWEGDVFHPW